METQSPLKQDILDLIQSILGDDATSQCALVMKQNDGKGDKTTDCITYTPPEADGAPSIQVTRIKS